MNFNWLIRPPYWVCAVTATDRQGLTTRWKHSCYARSKNGAEKDAHYSVRAHLKVCGGKAAVSAREATLFERVFLKGPSDEF